MQRMFKSATVKLTVWYMLILVTISLLFSVIVFVVATREISARLETFQIRLEGGDALTLPGPLSLTDVRVNQTQEARVSIFVGLIYVNLAVIGLGGIGSYLLARRTLRPIRIAHEAQSRFTSDASHELKTPLAAMKTELESALRDKSLTKTELHELLESNLEEVNKLSNLSQALLQLSRMNYSDVPLDHRVNVTKLLEETIHWYDPKKRRISLSTNRSPLYVEGNDIILRDLFRIVIDNAVKYSPEDTPIFVTATTNGRTATVTATNEGKGISEEHLPHIFERFYRIDQSRTNGNAKGFGLGLALAKQIAELHHGVIYCTSTPGKSTSFGIELPEMQKK